MKDMLLLKCTVLIKIRTQNAHCTVCNVQCTDKRSRMYKYLHDILPHVAVIMPIHGRGPWNNAVL